MTNPNIPIVNAGLEYVNGLRLSYSSTTVVALASGAARNSTNVNDIVLGSAVSIDSAVVGANGIDTGTLAASTFYAVFVIGDSTKYEDTAGLISTSATAPVLPFGYDMFRRVGYVLTDGSSHFLPFFQTGEDQARWMVYDTLISELSGGTATSFTDVDVATSVPVGDTLVMFQANMTPATADNQLKLRRNGSSSTNGSAQVYGSVATKVSSSQVIVPCDSSKIVEYLVSNGSDAATLLTAGYLDQL